VFIRIQTLVYEFAGGSSLSHLPAGSLEDNWREASENSINLLFSRDPERHRSFLHFLRSGAWGLFLARDGQWICYGWCAPPQILNPPHLPGWARSLGAHWIFYCHTREEFRRQGNYRRLLARLVDLVRSRTENPLILCDTLPDNFASRSVVLQSGFAARGVIDAYHLRVPLLGGLTIGGHWQQKQPHRPSMTIYLSGARQTASR